MNMRKLTAALLAYVMVNVALAVLASAADFADVPKGYWAREEIQYVTERGMFLGKTRETFAPDSGMTRGQMAMVLYRLAGQPETEAAMPYADVRPGAYYYDAIRWAAKNGIFTEEKLTTNTLTPDETITRGEFAVMLCHYAEAQGGTGPAACPDRSVFTDMEDADEETRAAILGWAYPQGILRGTTETAMNPNGRLTRAHVAAMLCRFDKANGKPEETVDLEPPPITPEAETPDAYLTARLEIIRLANEVRVRNGAKECAVSEALMDAAQMLAERKLTGHDLKIESGCRAAFGCRHGVACNLYRATNSGTVEYFPQGAVRSWENSPGHYAAMVNGGADSMGVGIHYDRETNTYYCVMFVGCCQTEGRLFGTAHS